MSEDVIEIVYSKQGNDVQCSEDCHMEQNCKWATWDYCPTKLCPGPGRYRLVRIEEDERDGILGAKQCG
jgi:hypothetical protein